MWNFRTLWVRDGKYCTLSIRSEWHLNNGETFFRIPMRRAIQSSAAHSSENRRIIFERLCQPSKIFLPESPVKQSVEKRPISMEVINRLSVPRKIKSPEQINYSVTSRPIQSFEYYEKLAQPRKILEEINDRESEQKLTSMTRTNEMCVPLSRLQRRKFMKGDNELKFSVSKGALEYKATAKIKKLAVPKSVPEDPGQSSGKSKRKKWPFGMRFLPFCYLWVLMGAKLNYLYSS